MRSRTDDGANLPELERLATLHHELSLTYDVIEIKDTTFNGTRRTLVVEVWLPLRGYEDAFERERVRADVLARTRASLQGIKAFERVTVRIRSGFTLGIATWSVSS